MTSSPRTVLLTGVGRDRGIGQAITRRLLGDGRSKVLAQSVDAFDLTRPWGADPVGTRGNSTGSE